MATYRDFLHELNVIIPGVARPIAEPVARLVVNEFCEDSRAWSFTLPAFNYAGDPFIDVVKTFARELIGREAELVDVIEVHVDGKRLYMNEYTRHNRLGVTINTPVSNNSVITLRVSVKPARDATEVDDSLLNDYAVDIAYGIAYRLCMQPKQEWSDAKLAMYYKDLYVQGKNQARHDANNARQGNRAVGYNYFGGHPTK